MRAGAVAVAAWAWGSVAVTIATLAGVAGTLVAVGAIGEVVAVVPLAARAVGVAAIAVGAAALPALALAVLLDELLPANRATRIAQVLLSASRDVPPLALGVVALGVGLGAGDRHATAVLALLAIPMLAQGARGALRRARRADRLAAVALGASPVQVLLHVVGPAAIPGLAALGLRSLARLVAAAAPVLLADPETASLALRAFHGALSGDLARAGAAVAVLIGVVIALDGLAGVLDRRIAWREAA
jgi:phosphate transport system permease protein